MAIDFMTWQRVRKQAQERELAERQHDTQFARPPLQVGISDQIIRDLIERVEKLENDKTTPAVNPFTIRAK